MPATSISSRPIDASMDSPRSTKPLGSADDATTASPEFDPVCLFQSLNHVASQSSNLQELLRGGGELISDQSDCLGLWATQKSDSSAFGSVVGILKTTGTIRWQTVQNDVQRIVRLADVSQQIQTTVVIGRPADRLIAAPIIFGDSVDTVIVGYFREGSQPSQTNQWLLGILAQTASTWRAENQREQTEYRTRSMNDVLSIIQTMERADSIGSASLILVNQLKRLTESQLVAFASANQRGLPRLLAVSDVESVNDQVKAATAMTHACGESIQAGQPLCYAGHNHAANSNEALALEAFGRQSGFDGCVSIPLIARDDQVIGSLLFAVSVRQARDSGYTQYLQRVARLIAGQLQLMLQAHRSVWQHAIESGRQIVTGQTFRLGLAIALLGIALMLLPWPYRVACDCEIQPVLRRFIAAPHDGVLEKNLVENGDVVSRDQAVARLDGRQLRIELAGLEAELQGAIKKRSASMADGQIADAQIALSQINKLNAEIRLVQDKLDHLEIRSPIDGIIVAGDLEKVEGAPVEMGQTLFEVGPLNRMLAEIAIPEHEIPFVRSGMPIHLKLNAFPFQTWKGTVAKIHARSEIRNQESVFIAEVELDNGDLKLKPGMQGKARIVSDSHALGWNLFHRPLEQLRYWTIW